jgi:hypothetical protein
MGVSIPYAYLHSCFTFVVTAYLCRITYSLCCNPLVEQLARNLLGPLGSDVTLGLEKSDGTKIDAKLCRAHLSKQKQAPL